MSEPPRPPGAPGRRAEPVSDDEYARGYAEGYGEGLREALREVLGHASRGHTAQELRILIESRLLRIRDDIELKRKSLTGPPRQPSWGALLRPPGPAAAPPAGPARPVPELRPGESYLFCEERPVAAAAFVDAHAERFPRTVLASFRPPPLPHAPLERVTLLKVAPGGSGLFSPGEISSRFRSAMEPNGGALVYFDAFEMMATEHGADPMLRFVAWATQTAQGTGSTLVLSVDPKGIDERTLTLLKRSFAFVQ